MALMCYVIKNNNQQFSFSNTDEFRITVSQGSHSDGILRCKLSPKISAVSMEIRWFKETDCVCFYKNRRLIEGESYKDIMSLCTKELEGGIVSLQLKGGRESCVGDYLCQVISGDSTEEITIRTSLQTLENPNEMSQQVKTLGFEQSDRKWTSEQRIKMLDSALLAVFNSLENNDRRKEDIQGTDDTAMQTDIEDKQDQTEEEDTQQKRKSRPMTTSACNAEEQENKQDVKVCIFQTGKTNISHFTDILQSRIENLTEVPVVSQSDVILVFCPIVSRAGTDIDNALERFTHKTETQLAVLVVLHHTFDPEKVVPDSSKYIKRTDILTVDCLFNEDRGYLECQKNSDAADRVVNWLRQQGGPKGVKIRPRQTDLTKKEPGNIQNQESERSKPNKNECQINTSSDAKKQKTGINKPGTKNFQHQESEGWFRKNICSLGLLSRQKMGNNEPSSARVHFPEKVKVFFILAGTINCHWEFFTTLRNRIGNLEEGRTVKESDIILVFCPIVSRAGTDIEAALNKIDHSTGSKLTVLVVLHHTFEPDKMVLDSSKYVKRTDILTVDCLFNEERGLLECQRNSDAVDKTVNWLTQQLRVRMSRC